MIRGQLWNQPVPLELLLSADVDVDTMNAVLEQAGTFAAEVPQLGGLVVPPGDPRALADALLRQLETPAPIRDDQETFDNLAPSFLAMYREVAG